MNPDGELVARYRKLHLFDVEVEGTTYEESATMAPGEEVVVASLAGVPVGLTLCYDLRFPELYRRLAAWGARLVTVPAAFTMETGRDHWEVLLGLARSRTRCTCWRRPSADRIRRALCYGNSMIVDPWGTVVARAGYARAWSWRTSTSGTPSGSASLPALAHRRADLFTF